MFADLTANYLVVGMPAADVRELLGPDCGCSTWGKREQSSHYDAQLDLVLTPIKKRSQRGPPETYRTTWHLGPEPFALPILDVYLVLSFDAEKRLVGWRARTT